MTIAIVILTGWAVVLSADDPWPSSGCSSPYPYPAPIPVGVPNHMNIVVEDPNLFNPSREYYLYLPPGYNGSTPLPVVFYFPSFYVEAHTAFETTKLFWASGQQGGDFIIVIPQGLNDCNQMNCFQQGLATVSWNAYGSGFNGEGPDGPVCDPNRTKWGKYPCYSSCRAISGNDTCGSCVSASCANDTLFFESLMNEVNSNFCTDTRRLYVTGMSVGAMMGLMTAMTFADKLAGAVLAAPGVIHGWWSPPVSSIPIMDIHGRFDDIIPANITNSHLYPKFKAPYADSSFSQDGFYYMPSYNWTRDIARANRCNMTNADGWPPNGSWVPWNTSIDGWAGWQCGEAFGRCPPQYPMVRCTWDGTHELPLVGKRTSYAHQHIPPNNLTHPQKVHAFAMVAWEFLAPLYRPFRDSI
eukprot:m.198735 g.198735  ORF g.198735 m.198735 type:complete len:412 (+) comp15300_c0_seq3:119-1354(+)